MALTRWLLDAREDSWLGCRRLIRERQTTAAVVVVLACGIALSVAIFTIADIVLRRPLPVLDQQRLVVLWGEAGGSIRTLPLTPQHFERFRRETHTLNEVAGTVSIDSWAQPVRDGEQTFRVNLSPVTGNFFLVLGSTAVLGRTLLPDDDHSGAAPVAVLSYSLWRGQFASDPAVLGRRLELRNSRVVTVVGVARPGLEYPAGTELWVPFASFSALEVTPIGRLSSQATSRTGRGGTPRIVREGAQERMARAPRDRCSVAVTDTRRRATCTPPSHCGRRGVTARGVFQRQ